MKTKLTALALTVGILISTGFAQPQQKTYEYKFVYQCDEKKTNNLSGEGWELADMSMAAYGSQGIATCVFKRSRP